MTKSQLIEHLGKRMPSLAAKEVEAVVNTVFEAMTQALQRGERIEIRGFGIFAVKVRGPKRGRNPKTGAQVDVPERRIPFFTVGKDLRERLNREAAEPAAAGASTGEAAPVAMLARS